MGNDETTLNKPHSRRSLLCRCTGYAWMILKTLNGHVRGHYNVFIHVSLTAERVRAHTHTHIHSLYYLNHPAARQRATTTPPVGGRSSSDEVIRSACALTPAASISRWPSYRVGAICRSPDSYPYPCVL